MDPALLAALTGLLEGRTVEAPDEAQAPDDETVPETEESLYEQLARLEAQVN